MTLTQEQIGLLKKILSDAGKESLAKILDADDPAVMLVLSELIDNIAWASRELAEMRYQLGELRESICLDMKKHPLGTGFF